MIVILTLFLYPFLATSISKDKYDTIKNGLYNILKEAIPSLFDDISSQSVPTKLISDSPTPTPQPLPSPTPTPDLSKVPSLGAILGTCIAALALMTATTSYFCFKKTSTEPDQEQPSFSTAAQILLDKKYEPV